MRIRRLLILVLLAIPAAQLVVVAPAQWAREDPMRDSWHYWTAARRIAADSGLYQPPQPPGPIVPGTQTYVYPPVHAAVLSFLAIDYRSFARVSFAVGLVLFWVYAFSLGRLSAGRWDTLHGLAWGAALTVLIGPMAAVNTGNVEPVLWCVFAGALLWPTRRGGGLMAYALVKPTALVALAVAVMRAPRGNLLGAGIVACGAAMVCVAALGPAEFVASSWTWIKEVFPSVAQGQVGWQRTIFVDTGTPTAPFWSWLTTGNQSVAFAPLYLFVGPDWKGDLPLWMRLYLTTIAVVAPGTTAYLFRRSNPTLQIALVMAVALLFAPVFRISYSALLLAPLAVWIGSFDTQRVRPDLPGGLSFSGSPDR